ncbi:MAG TPA: NAD-dependent epimerase/dehydratase family protein [Vicinamibacteria bacterium]|nr:NAD-dependent epimerase/dehydratase family protein [Vicinamibacteria bacterium]
MARLAITGASSFIGARLLRRLVEARGAEAVLVLDVAPPPSALHGVHYHQVDLTLPEADRRLLEILRDEEVDTVVHTAFFTDPRRDAAYSHELESIGTLNLMAACASAGVAHVVQRSFTAVYGARGQNPNFLTEEHTPRPNERFWWIKDKLEAEVHALAFARRYPRMAVTVLRLAPLIGPGVYTFYTRIFAKRVVSVVMGYDPLLQFLHPDDAVAGFDAVLARRAQGIFNVVPRRAMTLLTALHLAEKVTVPVPHPLASALADALWSAGLSDAPGGFLDYVRFLFVADGAKARRELGFEARYDSREALMQYLRYRYPQRYPPATRPEEATA